MLTMMSLCLLLLFLSLTPHTNGFPYAQDPFAAGPTILNVTTSCTVKLFENQSFATYDEIFSFPYIPPVGDCAGPWDRVILYVQAQVNGTVQFDRVGAIWMDEVEILRFTTPEPPSESIKWNVQRDLSVYGPYFQEFHSVHTGCGNIVNSEYNGVITMTATLHFFNDGSVDPIEPADYVMGIGVYGFGNENTIKGSTVMENSFTLPFQNAYRVYLDLYATGHNCEEFWYTNPPDALANITGAGTCTGGSSREFIITLDGDMVMGVQAPFPVIYTGGINPLMWRPQTGIYSFNVPPYRFDVSPFLGMMNDGAEHKLGITITNNSAPGFWYVTPVLVLWRDELEAIIEGSLESYSFVQVQPSASVSVIDVEWNETYSSSLAATGALVGTTNGASYFPSISSEVYLENQNVFKILQGMQITTMAITISMTSSSFDRNYTFEYPFALSMTYQQNASGFTISSDVNYSVYRKYTSFLSNDDAITYANGITSSAFYSKNTVNGTATTVELGVTSQNYSITTTQAALDEICFFQNIESDGGFVSRLPVANIGSCIPSTFCSEFNACADPSDAYTFDSGPPIESGGDLPFRCPHRDCPRYQSTRPNEPQPSPLDAPPVTSAPASGPNASPVGGTGQTGPVPTSASPGAVTSIWWVIGFALTTRISQAAQS